LPFTSSGGYRVVKPQGADDARSLRVSANVVGPDYFTTMGIPLLSGREFGDSDLAGGSAVTAIGASLARAVFGTANAVGRVIVFDDSFGRTEATVIGVVDDTKTTRLAPETELQAYTPGLRSPRMALVVRLRHEPQTADLQALQTTARAIDPDIPIEFTPLTDLLFNEISLPALRTGLLMTFAIQAVLIGAIGVLGLVRWRVAQRAPELALRIALGATPRVLCIFLLRTEMAWVFAGIVAGTLVTLVVTPMAASMLTFVSPIDATVLPGTIALLVTVALTAVIPIARRVTLDAHGLLAAFRDPTRS
jgi:putative ABC transport system permease protein